MKRLLLILFLFLSVSSFPATIEKELNSIYMELQEIFDITPDFFTEIIPGEGRSYAESSENSAKYIIKIYEEDYSLSVARHEMAHIFLFELIRRGENFPDEVPVWYHEFVAIWFQNLNRPVEPMNYRSSLFFDFMEYGINYPDDSNLFFFYDSIRSFASFMEKREDYGSLVIGVTQSYLGGLTMEEAFRSITGSSLGILIIEWRLIEAFPYLMLFALVIIFIYFIARGSGGIGKNIH